MTQEVSGRQRHDEKITFYCTSDEAVSIDSALLALRRNGIKVDRGRLIREAVAYVLDLAPEDKKAFAARLDRPGLF